MKTRLEHELFGGMDLPAADWFGIHSHPAHVRLAMPTPQSVA